MYYSLGKISLKKALHFTFLSFFLSLILAIVDTSSTILYYEIGAGLIEPREPTNQELEKMQRVPVWSEQKRKWKNNYS